ncbi:cytoskeleton-associated protein 2-like [Grus japonensis]|uniref:Cytoskeleton-associated protein 2-like n=1 Tax=Grus japonensis TaxID=30415 RepID=A0ABC9XTH9_GRUJA
MQRAGAATQEEQRRRLQEYVAAKEKLKCPSAKPLLKDRRNHLNPPLEPVSKLDHVDRNKKDVLRNVAMGAQRDGKLGAKSTQRAGHAAQQKSSNISQRAAVARRVPKTPSAADRKKQLEEWLASKGKIYKRPPMTLLQKNAVKLSWRNVKEKEKQEKPEQLCLEKINNILTECLKLIEEPLQELREVVLDILKAADQTSEGEKAEQPVPWEPTTPCLSERQHAAATPCLTGRSLTSLPVSIKLQVTSASRGKELLERQELKFLTPVRRSLRIERAGSHYPEMLKDHDPVVSSLSEILDAEEETQFFFRKNKALPEVAELEGLSSYPSECC